MFTPLETAMMILLGATLMTLLGPLLSGRDAFRHMRVILVLCSAVAFQIHVVIEGPIREHWPLYTVGLGALIGVGLHWYSTTHAAMPAGADATVDTGDEASGDGAREVGESDPNSAP